MKTIGIAKVADMGWASSLLALPVCLSMLAIELLLHSLKTLGSYRGASAIRLPFALNWQKPLPQRKVHHRKFAPFPSMP